MKPKTLNLILKICLICIVLDLPLISFNMILGAFIMIILIVVLLFTGWKAWKLMQTNPDAFRVLSESEKDLSMKDLPPRLIILLVVILVLAILGDLSVFSFNPFIYAMLATVVLLLLVYYFLQKYRLQKKVQPMSTQVVR